MTQASQSQFSRPLFPKLWLPTTTRLRRSSSVAALSIVSCASLFVGCGSEPAIDYPIEREVREAMLDADQLSYSEDTERRISVSKIRADLASYSRADGLPPDTPGSRIQPVIGSPPAEEDPPIEGPMYLALQVDDPPKRPALPTPPAIGEDEVAGASASDVGPVEEVPTPPARPEMKGELVPTPQGIREKLVRNPVPAPRVAADTKRDSRADSKPAKVTEQAKEASERATELIDVTTEMVAAQGGPEDFESWPAPDTMLFITGNQHGYIEPCGCTGLDRQKGGLARRFTFLRQLRKKGLDVLPIDAGNQIRRIGRQAEIKFERTADALSEMKYEAVGFGPGDMRLGVGNLIQVSYADNPEDAMFLAANIVLLEPELLPKHKIIRRGHWNVGMTNILDPKALEAPTGDDIVVGPPEEAAKEALASMNADGANFRVLTFFGKEDAAKKLMNKVDGYDLIIVAGGYGEPLYRPEVIDGSTARMIVTGNKGMYVGLIGLYSDEPFRYARVELSHKFPDAPEMRRLMAEYQQQLEQLDLSGLGLSARPHLSGKKFVGSETCGKCHTEAYEIWETTAHVDATAHIVEPTEGRGDVPRHFDPECLSCHVTGWDPQGYFPYESGYLSLDLSSHLTGNGCENCHGPGAEHSAAEEEGSGVSEERKKSLRLAMQLPLEKARDKCMECHDLDNSPDFHVENAFEDEYWPMVEHYGVD